MGGGFVADKSDMGSFVTVLFGAGVGVGIVLGLWLLADLVSDLQRHVHRPLVSDELASLSPVSSSR
jgi:hypothetical protein